MDTPLYRYFPEYTSSICNGEKKDITLYHLLTMTAGFQWDEQSHSYLDSRNSSVAASASGGCIKSLFERPVSNKPGEKFVYNNNLPVTINGFMHCRIEKPMHSEMHLMPLYGLNAAAMPLLF